MDSALTWGAVIAALAGIVAGIKFWMDLGGRTIEKVARIFKR